MTKSTHFNLMDTIHHERRRAGGNEKCLLIDCGDTLQGEFLGAFTRGEAGIRFLNCMNYDAWILGNHDLDFGVNRLKSLLSMCTVPVINGNLKLSKFPAFPAYKFYMKSNAKIAVIGMNASKLGNWLGGNKSNSFINTPAIPIIERILPAIMEAKPDMIIAVLHQAYAEHDVRQINEIKELAYTFPQIDLILGGHSHRKIAGKRLGNSWYVQPGHHGKTIGKIIAQIDLVNHQVLSIQSTLIQSTQFEKQTRCVPLTKLIEQAEKKQNQKIQFINRAITSSGVPGVNCHISDIICRAIRWKTKVPIVFHGKLSHHEWKENTYLTEGDLFKTIPYENSLVVAHLTPDEIKQIIEEQLNYKNHRSFNGIHGLIAGIDAKTNKVRSMKLGLSQILEKDVRVKVALNSYTMAGGGNRFNQLKTIINQPSAKTRDTNLNIRDIVREYLINASTWEDFPKSWLKFIED